MSGSLVPRNGRADMVSLILMVFGSGILGAVLGCPALCCRVLQVPTVKKYPIFRASGSFTSRPRSSSPFT
jgi:hypothetical protein